MANPNRVMAQVMARKSVVTATEYASSEKAANEVAVAMRATGEFDMVRATRYATGPKKKTVWQWVVRGYVKTFKV